MIKLKLFTAQRLLLPLVLLAGGCRFDGTGTKMQWAPDMADAPTSKPQKSYLDPPEGAVPMDLLAIAGKPVFYPKTPEDSEKQLTMPAEIGGDANGAAKGQVLFETFCLPCHGADAKGQGTILYAGFPQPPDLTLPVYQQRGDGFFFYRITFGSAIMPGYGHAITANERWYIVRHLRTLQGAK